MSVKTTNIISKIFMFIPAAMLLMSALMKLSHAAPVVEGLTKGGFGSYISFLGVIELLSLALFVYPKTYKVGFLLLNAYLGGAFAVELASGEKPVAAILLMLIWISVYLRNRSMFVSQLTPSE